MAAYGFEEASGTTVVDASRYANHGTISGATRISGGRFGKATKFDGVNDWITVNDSASLDLTTGMTLEAWVYPTIWMSDWTAVIMKEQPGQQVYALYGNSDRNQPTTVLWVNGGERLASGVTQLPPNQWTHLAATYDGQYQSVYVNGTQVAMQAQTGAILTSDSPLRIGGDAVWGEYFTGYIDEVRIYNRALTQAQIVADANSPVVTLMYSTSSNRSNAKPLNGAVVTGYIYPFTTPDSNVKVQKVEFWLDNPNPDNPTDPPKRTESAAPYDYAGGTSSTATRVSFAKGQHTITARYTMIDGTVGPFVTATFTRQ